MQRLFSGLTIGLCACLTGNALADGVVDFESITPSTQYGAAFGTSVGDLIFTEGGVDVRAVGFGTAFSIGTVGGFTDSEFPTTPMTLSNISLLFEPGLINGSAPTSVSFEYADFGGNEELGINGTVFTFNDFASAAPTLGGASVTVTSTPFTSGNKGLVTISGIPITSLEIGGQELGIDNVTFVPEPTSLAMLAFGGLALSRRRRTQ